MKTFFQKMKTSSGQNTVVDPISKTNQVAASITSPATSRNRTTSALNMGAPVCVHIVLNQTADGEGTIPRLAHSWVKFACPDMHARQTKFPPDQALLAVREFGAARSRRAASPFSAGCLGQRFAYTAPRQLRRRSTAGAPCGSTRPPDEQRAAVLPSPLNLSTKDGGCAKTSVGRRSSTNYEPVDDN
jgi:hypothetical protein